MIKGLWSFVQKHTVGEDGRDLIDQYKEMTDKAKAKEVEVKKNKDNVCICMVGGGSGGFIQGPQGFQGVGGSGNCVIKFNNDVYWNGQ